MSRLPSKTVLKQILKDDYGIIPPETATKEELHAMILDLNFKEQDKAFKQALKTVYNT